MKLFLYIIGLSYLIACSGSPNKQYPRYSDFPETKAICAQVIYLDTILFRYPSRITIRDSISIILDLHNADHYFHAFTYPEWRHIVSFGKRGEAPEEMLSAENFQFISLDSLWALDANKMEITRWKIIPSLGTAERVEEIELDKKLVRSLDFHTTNLGFLILDYMGEHRFWEVNYNGKTIKSNGTIPSETINKETSYPVLAQAWRSFIGYNSLNGIMALATQLGETIEIYNLKDNTHKIIYGPEGEPIFQIVKDGTAVPTGIMGFTDIKVTNKYIYTVFRGFKIKDKYAAFEHGEHWEDGARNIYVFDLQGKPVKKYTLNHPIYGININEETNTIVATKIKSDDPIVVFKM